MAYFDDPQQDVARLMGGFRVTGSSFPRSIDDDAYFGPRAGTPLGDMLLANCPRCGRKNINVGLRSGPDGPQLTPCCAAPPSAFQPVTEQGYW